MVARLIVGLLVVSSTAHAQLTQDSFRSFQNAKDNAAAADARMANAKKIGLQPLPTELHPYHECLDPSAISSDDAGFLDSHLYSVLDIVGPHDMLIAMPNPNVQTLWISGYPTKGLADGDKVRVVGMVEVVGTKTYQTVEGSNSTVREIKFVSLERQANIKADGDAKREAALIRTWLDSTGQYRTVGKFIDFKDGKANIERKSDGKAISVPLSRLSVGDQKWIRDELKRRKEDAKKKSEPVSIPSIAN